LTVVFPPLCY